MGEAERWAKLEEIIRRVVREELAISGKGKQKVELVNGKWIGITESLLSAWSLAYPAVNVQEELNKSAAWIMSNPTLAPKTQFSRFLLTWLSRTQDRLSIRSIPTRSDPGPGKKLCSYCTKVATNSPNRIWACDDHILDAMDQKPQPLFKNQVEAKPVAGRD